MSRSVQLERPNHLMEPRVAPQLARHRLELPRVDRVEQEGLDHIIPVMSEGDLVGFELRGDPIEDPAPKP